MMAAITDFSNNNEAFADGGDYKNPPDATPRREGGDDALAETSPLDSLSDEKVIFNEPQKSSVEEQSSNNTQAEQREEKDII